ncbi:MAG: AsmA family protein [Myxococcota bacterium]|nr:AsmA family protein [Myxococcota bacterium]
MTPTPPPKKRLLLRVLLAAAVLLVAGLLALPFLIRSERVLAEVRDRVLPSVSAKLGRQVQVASMELDLFPQVKITLLGLEVAGGPGEPPLATAERSVASPRLWPLLRSLGSDVQVDGLLLENVKLAVVKRPDGEWSYEDLGETPPAEATPGTPSPDSPGEEVAWVLSSLEMRNLEVRMIDQTSQPQKAVRLPGLSLTTGEVGFGRPLTARFQGQGMEGELGLDHLPPSFDGLAPEAWPRLSGGLKVNGMPLAVVRDYLPSGFSALITGGRLMGEAVFSSAPDGQWVMSGPMRVEQLSLRGNPATGKAVVRLAFPPWNPDALSTRLDPLALQGPGVDLGGWVSAEGTPLKVRFELAGNLLDLDALLAALPAEPTTGVGGSGTAGAPGEATAADEDAPPAGEPLVSASARDSLREVAAEGTLKISKVVRGKLQATDLDARATLQGGVLTLPQAQASLFGGRMDASGTRIDVREATPQWTLAAGLDRVDLGAALAAVGGTAAVQGLARGKLTLTGEGNDWSALIKTLVGQGQLVLAEGGLPAVDLGSELAAALPGGRLAGLAERAGQGTTLKELSASFQVKDGWLMLTRPLNVESRFGTASLGGRIGLDQRLDLQGEAKLAPQFVAQVTGGRLNPSGPVPLPLRLGGTLKAPSVAPGSPRGAIRGAVEEKVRSRVEDELRDRARQVLPQLRR